MQRPRRFSLCNGGVRVAVAVAAFSFVSTSHGGIVVHVDDDATAPGDGLDWSTAFAFLSDAIAFASDPYNDVEEVRVAGGTYRPDRSAANPEGTLDRTATFDLSAGVVVRGGFAGPGLPDPDERDPQTYATILSGDLLEDDDSGGDDGENSHHVVMVVGAAIAPVLDGVTVTAGNVEGSTTHGGAGMLISNGAAVVRDCAFVANDAVVPGGSGGGVHAGNGDVTFERVVFRDNAATDVSSSSSAGGGALFCFGGDTRLVECTFEENTAYYGGGIFVAGNVETLRCRLEGNTSVHGGAMYRKTVSNKPNELCLTGTTFVANVASSHGGAIQVHSGNRPISVIGCRFLGNEAGTSGGAVSGVIGAGTVYATLFAGNTAGSTGGALYPTEAGSHFLNCTFSANTAVTRGGAINLATGQAPPSMILTNCIFWANTAGGIGGEAAQIDRSSVLYEWPIVNYCLVEGLTGIFGGSGNLGDDPLFADPDGADDDPSTVEDNDYRLAAGSPCIDAGHNWAVPIDSVDLDGDGDTLECMPLDLDGAPRFTDDPAKADTGCGLPVTVEIGAYEAAGTAVNPVLFADVDGNGSVGFADLLTLLSVWGPCGACCRADLDMNQMVNFSDLLGVLSSWN